MTMNVSKTTDSGSSTQADLRWKQVAIAAASLLACQLTIVALVGAWSAFPGIVFVLAAISVLAASVATLLPSTAWHLVALIGAVIGCGSAFAYIAYAMSRI